MYKFAVNQTKLQRAIAICGAGAKESEVLAEYIKMGGLVAPGYGVEEVEAPVVVEEEAPTVEEEEVVHVEEAPMPKKRATKK